MKDRMIVLVFRVPKNTVNLNIGEHVELEYDSVKEHYCLNTEFARVSNQLFTPNSDDVKSLLEFVAKKDGRIVYIWDNERNIYLDNTIVEVKAANGEYIIVAPSEESQYLIGEGIDQEPSIEELLKGLLGDTENDMTCEKCCDTERKCAVAEENKEEKKVKEETNMFSNLGSSFGKIGSDQFRLSINGLAVKGKDGKYVTFNPETRELVEVTTGFFDDMKDLLFLMPTTELEVGDIIIHQNKPYYITVSKDNVVKGIDFEDAIESTLVPKTNVFGMKYYTKVFNCLGTNNILGTDIASNPMMAYALMGGKDFDLSKIMMFQALSGQGKGIADFSENPIMLMALMSNENGKNDLSDFAKMQILSGLSNKKKTTKETKKEN
mgnify:FL=1|jgi:hypothetical protein